MRWLAWLGCVLCVAATIALGAGRDDTFDLAIYSLMTIVLAVSGSLIVARVPGHGTGLLFCGLAAWLAVTELADSYGATDLSGHEYGEWVISWSWIGDMTFFALILMTFPDGRVLGPRWRWVPRVLILGASLATAGYALGTAEAEGSFRSGTNPIAVAGLPEDLLLGVGMPLLLAATLAGVVSLILRIRRSSGIERQQLKWFCVAAALVGLTVPLAIAFWFDSVFVQVALGTAFIAIPLSACIAILRYRLYDIDLVIRRTLTYTMLTAALVATYLVGVLLLQLVLPERSDLAVAGSTLAVAAVFGPARARIQELVDRRFFRARYDATRTLASFGARLRDEVSIDAIDAELRATVATTVQPAHVSVWLRS